MGKGPAARTVQGSTVLALYMCTPSHIVTARRASKITDTRVYIDSIRSHVTKGNAPVFVPQPPVS